MCWIYNTNIQYSLCEVKVSFWPRITWSISVLFLKYKKTRGFSLASSKIYFIYYICGIWAILRMRLIFLDSSYFCTDSSSRRVCFCLMNFWSRISASCAFFASLSVSIISIASSRSALFARSISLRTIIISTIYVSQLSSIYCCLSGVNAVKITPILWQSSWESGHRSRRVWRRVLTMRVRWTESKKLIP